MEVGLYESLITAQVKEKLARLDRNLYYIADEKQLDQEEAAYYLSSHLSRAITRAMHLIHTDKAELRIAKQIEISNSLLRFVFRTNKYSTLFLCGLLLAILLR